MRTQPLQKNCGPFGQQKDMNTQTPKASSSKSSRLRAAGHGYSTPSSDSLNTESGIDRTTSTWHVPLVSRDGPSIEQRYIQEHDSRTEAGKESMSRNTYTPPSTPPTPSTTSSYRDIPEELSQIIISMQDPILFPGRGEELAEAFREASIFPPITTQSLSELDIQNIINNVRLRRDVNFDRDLSFRPNLDGARGHAKQEKTEMYWMALVAELQLYASVFQGTPDPQVKISSYWLGLASNAKRRIPVMFQTIQEILKSLVPDRDHTRVDEHLDVPMLMQEIERGVCDLVRLAEWMAQLLKEHCAPMRDGWVDQMVRSISDGVTHGSLEKIVEGLRELLGILETMKLDVANHQIRKLKTLLIEDTINFEKRYHLDRLVSHRSRVNINAAQAWYLNATTKFAAEYPHHQVNSPQVKLEIFVRAVIAQFLNKSGSHGFPETFYLDQDRLHTLKAEIEDLIHVEVCMDTFADLLQQFGHDGPLSSSVRQNLRSALLAIMGDALGYGSSQWVLNSEALSWNCYGRLHMLPVASFHIHTRPFFCANNKLLQMFRSSHSTHNPQLEIQVLRQVLSCTTRNTSTSPSDLFNNLVPVARSVPPPTTHFLHLQSTDTSPFPNTLNPESTQWQDIVNRITHIILLHWQVWERITYVQEGGSEPSPPTSTATATASLSHSSKAVPAHALESDTQMVTAMKTGEPPESGSETHVAHETS